LLAINGALGDGSLLLVLVDLQEGILIEEVQGHVLVRLVLLYRKDHLNQLQALDLLSVGLAQDLDVLEEFDNSVLDRLDLAELFQLEVGGVLEASLIEGEVRNLHKGLLVYQLNQEVRGVVGLSQCLHHL
jgi:hypothetical protein